ncbi:hypothetical protein ABZ943_40100, partial [Streptomyces rubiginosohelvolus]
TPSTSNRSRPCSKRSRPRACTSPSTSSTRSCFPAYLLEGGPQRFRTDGAGKGHGLGLTIAMGQAAVIGARLEFVNPPDGGALARLTLPEYVRLDEEDSAGNTGEQGAGTAE